MIGTFISPLLFFKIISSKCKLSLFCIRSHIYIYIFPPTSVIPIWFKLSKKVCHKNFNGKQKSHMLERFYLLT